MGQSRRQAANFVHLMGNRESLDIFGENVIVEIFFFFFARLLWQQESLKLKAWGYLRRLFNTPVRERERNGGGGSRQIEVKYIIMKMSQWITCLLTKIIIQAHTHADTHTIYLYVYILLLFEQPVSLVKCFLCPVSLKPNGIANVIFAMPVGNRNIVLEESRFLWRNPS